MKLKEIGEFGFIDRIAPLGLIRPEGVVKGIGDDCAVIGLDESRCLLVTTDLLVERVHFRREWGGPEIIGAKALAVNLSDIAACGGVPRDAFISLAIPDDIDVEWLDGFYAGMSALARDHDVNLLGGDTTGSRSDLVINVALTGEAKREEVLFRHTARPGDLIALTGPIGESGAGCEILLTAPALPQDVSVRLKRAHLEPRPHIKEGRILAQSRACTAAIDVSDGLSSDLGHLCQDSGVGAIVYEDRIPVAAELRQAGRALEKDPLAWILNGGEDYVLLAAIKPSMVQGLEEEMQRRHCALLVIGEFVSTPGMGLMRADGAVRSITPAGWDHFL